jgi:hypothetical protein
MNSMKNLSGSLTTYSAAAMLLGFGLFYLLRSSFMPYHEEAISRHWEDVEPATRYLLLALMRATAGGFISTAIAIAFLQYKLTRHNLFWFPFFILVLGTIHMVCSLYAILIVYMNTAGRPPIALDLIGEALLITGFFFNRNFLLTQAKS